jgi:hypothetical protein
VRFRTDQKGDESDVRDRVVRLHRSNTQQN